MIVWLAPAALVGLIAIAGPIAVHLLRRQHARRITLPSLRFVTASDESAVRLRRISDAGLLLVRSAIVGTAAVALAQPLLLTDRRNARWAERIARVVIVDTSESARGGAAAEMLAAERAGASPVETIETDELSAALGRAAAWLSHSLPVRREIVVLSDFQQGALDTIDIERVPSGIGLRFVRVSNVVPAREGPTLRTLREGAVMSGSVTLDGRRTSVTYESERLSTAGLQILTASPAKAAFLTRVITRAGATAPDSKQPIVIGFGSLEPLRPPAAAQRDWTLAAAQRLLRAISTLETPVDVSAAEGTLTVRVHADPDSLAAAQVTAAALDARVDPDVLAEHETERISDARLAAWSRAPAPPDPAQWRQTDESDGRWLWGIALLLLALESVLRRPATASAPKVEAHAA